MKPKIHKNTKKTLINVPSSMFQVSGSKGVVLFLTIAILSVLTTALLAMIAISISQIKIIQATGDASTAFCAADTGIERVLYALYQESYIPMVPECLYSDSWSVGGHIADYQVCVIGFSPLTIYSTGSYKQTIRRVEIRID